MSRFAAKARPGSRVDSWSPTEFSPMRFSPHLWLDAGDASTFTYSSGTAITQWNDKSGNGFNVSIGVGTAQPSRSGTRNGIPTVVFDGGDFLNYSGTTNFNVGTGSIFWVGCENSTVANARIVTYYPSTGNDYDRQDAFAIGLGPTSPALRSTVTRYLSGSTGIAAVGGSRPAPYAVNYSYLVSDGNLGTSETFKPAGYGGPRSGTFLTAPGGILISATYQAGGIAGGSRLNGEIAEIIVYSTQLNYQEVRLVTDYLVKKWGI